MIKREQLFEAIGNAEPELLIRSEMHSRRWPKRSLFAAACLALLFTLGLIFQRPWAEHGPHREEHPPATSVIELNQSAVGTLHLLSFKTTEIVEPAISDFFIYVNEEQYAISDEEDVYLIQPTVASPEGCPPCELAIQHSSLPPEQSAAAAAEALKMQYTEVSSITDAVLIDGLYLRGSNGTEWDAAQMELFFTDDRQGGSFILAACYFTEAEEGHGVRFRDMIGTFRVISSDERVPDWMQSLQDTAEQIFPALFANDLNSIYDLLANNASVDVYGEDIHREISVASIDYSVDDDQNPFHAVVSVKHRSDLEDVCRFLTMEFMRTDEQWKLINAHLDP